MDILFEIIAEIFGQVVFEFVVEGMVEAFKRFTNGRVKLQDAILVFILVTIAGIGLGFLSLQIYGPMLKQRELQIANLVVTPIVAALIMQLVGRIKTRRGKPTLVLERFVAAYLFALSFALTRFFFQT